MRSLLLILIAFSALALRAGKIENAYKALAAYDYFKAKELFYAALKKEPVPAAYGLAIIYARNDNPFHNNDSAALYITRCLAYTDTVTYSGFKVSSSNIQLLAVTLAEQSFRDLPDSANAAAYEHFSSLYFFGEDSIRQAAWGKRDQLEFQRFLRYNRSDSIRRFLLLYPESELREEARNVLDEQQYNEQIPKNTEAQLLAFIRRYPRNRYTDKAKEALFTHYKNARNKTKLAFFVREFPKHSATDDAWKLLYTLSVTNYNKQEMQDFLKQYPDFPFKESIEKEIELNDLVLLPYRENDLWGFIDLNGTIRIPAQFEETDVFSEGYCVVMKNDTYFYIGKEGKKAFDRDFLEANTFHDNKAVVKTENGYCLINRTGEVIAGPYEELSEESDRVYIAKKGKYGAVDRYGNVVIPFNYDKLGDFKNGSSYYELNGKLGFIWKTGKVTLPRYEWVSEFFGDVAIVKFNGSYGLINSRDSFIVKPNYNRIDNCGKGYFLLIKNNLYGFVHQSGCFLTPVDYDFQGDLKTSDYSNGSLFKLIKNKKTALMDANGRLSVEFGSYEKIFFANSGLIRIMKKGKYGYADRKLTIVIPCQYDAATDFNFERAIVTKGEKSALIDVQGNTLFEMEEADIDPMDEFYYTVERNERFGLINRNGTLVIPVEYKSISPLNEQFLFIERKGRLFLFNMSTGKFLGFLPEE